MKIQLFIFLLLSLVSCRFKPPNTGEIIDRHYIDSTDALILNRNYTNNDFFRPLRELKSNRYLETVQGYFIEKKGAKEIKKDGFILIVSEPWAFDCGMSFQINDKQFHYNFDPYYQHWFKKPWNRNKGRCLYFIYDNFNINGKRNVVENDTLIITLYQYIFSGSRFVDQYEEKKIPIYSRSYVVDSIAQTWNYIGDEIY